MTNTPVAEMSVKERETELAQSLVDDHLRKEADAQKAMDVANLALDTANEQRKDARKNARSRHNVAAKEGIALRPLVWAEDKDKPAEEEE